MFADNTFQTVKELIYNKCSFKISNFIQEKESKAYNACTFKLNDLHILYRDAKITPKKVGQFVTCWKRNSNNLTEPFHENDQIDYYVITVKNENNHGQFVIPKAELIKKGIISSHKKEGKRAFRVYPPWDKTLNKQAQRSQKWQLNYFFEISNSTNLDHVKNLYSKAIHHKSSPLL